MEPLPLPAHAPTLAFTARRPGYVRLLLLTSIATLLTAGLYRFWARTRIRRYLWRHVRFLGDPLEYTGTGAELFFGFLIVIAVLFPLGLAYNAIDALVPPRVWPLRVGAEMFYYAGFFALLQIGFYRMWRYRMSRTRWRAIRFGLDGSSWTYLRLAVGWTLLCVLTLGIAYPWMQVDLWRYQMEHTRLGTERFAFRGRARTLLVPWLCVNIPAAICLAVIVVFGATSGLRDLNDLRIFAENNGALLIAAGTVLFAGLICLPITYLWFRVRLTRLQVGGLTLGAARFHCGLRMRGLIVAGAVGVLLCLLAMAPVLLLAEYIMPAAPGDFGILAVILAAVLVIVIWPLIWAATFGFAVIAETVRSIRIDHPEALERASQDAPADIRTGEGLADALDMGGF